MYKEIGSEFWDIPLCDQKNKLFPAETQWFISGRSALRAIIADGNFKSIAIPVWCCDSIITPFLDAGIRVEFYDLELPNTEAILEMSFFGFNNRKLAKRFPGVVIRDLTHAIFSNDIGDADYYFGSLRKWAGFWTGGFAWGFKHPVTYGAFNNDYVELRRTAMEQKRIYIDNASLLERKCQLNKRYLEIFYEAEGLLDSTGVAPADARDVEAAGILDINYIRRKRRENAQILLTAFSDIAIFPEMGQDDCPLFVPIRVKERDELRKYLIKKEIYCPVHWPISVYHRMDRKILDFYHEELSLVCDQRYGIEAMQRIISTIHEYWNRREQ